MVMKWDGISTISIGLHDNIGLYTMTGKFKNIYYESHMTST